MSPANPVTVTLSLAARLRFQVVGGSGQLGEPRGWRIYTEKHVNFAGKKWDLTKEKHGVSTVKAIY